MKYEIYLYSYPEKTDSIHYSFINIDNKKKFQYSFDEDIKYNISFDLSLFNHCINRIVYIISLTEFFKNSPKIRKNLIEIIDKDTLFLY